MEKQREKRHWTPTEDQKLIKAKKARENSEKSKNSFAGIAAEAGLQRNDKNCWERWNYQLNRDLNKGEWSEEEDNAIILLNKSNTNRWSSMAKNPLVKRRNPNDIKSRWNNHLKGRLAKMSDHELQLLHGELHLLLDYETSEHSVSAEVLQASMDALRR